MGGGGSRVETEDTVREMASAASGLAGGMHRGGWG